MKTKFFRENKFLLFWRGLGGGLLCLFFSVALSAQNGVTVTNLAVGAGTVTFNVSWNKATMPVAVWSDSVWVFVDYNDAGVMKRLPLLLGATLTATSAPDVGKVIEVSGNDKGVWVIGNARSASAGSFSATVQLLTTTTTATGVCAYASNYPPVAEYLTAGTLKFTGTPPYDLVLSTGPDKTYGNYNLLPDQTLDTFTDKTGAPGIINCIPMNGDIDFAVPDNVPRGQQLSFSVAENPSIPNAEAITYTWSATDFNPDTHTGTIFNTTAPAMPNVYPVTLTAHSRGYCDLPKMKDVPVVDCHSAAGWIGEAGVAGKCAGNNGGKIGITTI